MYFIWCTELEETGNPGKCGKRRTTCRNCPYGKKIKRNISMRGGS